MDSRSRDQAPGLRAHRENDEAEMQITSLNPPPPPKKKM